VAAAQDRITEIRVHGNHTTPDEDVLALSGLAVGDEASDRRLAEAQRKLRDSGRFDDVEVRRRLLSISDPSQILVMIVVTEQAAVSEGDLEPGPLRRLRAASMVMPILNYADGYGFTYGARIAFLDPLGPRSRVAVPLSWGGERRAGVEVERLFGGDPTSDPARTLRLRGGVADYRRVNPHYDVADNRLEAGVRAEQGLASWLRVSAGARTAQVTFGGAGERHDAAGVDVTVDTRLDPSFPRNAVYASTGVERLAFRGGSARRSTTDLRGYVGLGANVVGIRSLFVTSASGLPPSEQPLLGGTDTLRGYAAGHRAGDNLASVSLELRVPLSSPVNVGRFGVETFVDWGTTWATGARLKDQQWDRGIGGGIYFGGGPIIANVDIAWPRNGGARGNFGLGVSF
jgi:outer membrane protein assembly factor BamA